MWMPNFKIIYISNMNFMLISWYAAVLEGTMKYMIVYNHYRKTAKIENEWKNFAWSQNLQVGIEIIFEFPDATSNFDLFWIYL